MESGVIETMSINGLLAARNPCSEPSDRTYNQARQLLSKPQHYLALVAQLRESIYIIKWNFR